MSRSRERPVRRLLTDVAIMLAEQALRACTCDHQQLSTVALSLSQITFRSAPVGKTFWPVAQGLPRRANCLSPCFQVRGGTFSLFLPLL